MSPLAFVRLNYLNPVLKTKNTDCGQRVGKSCIDDNQRYDGQQSGEWDSRPLEGEVIAVGVVRCARTHAVAPFALCRLCCWLYVAIGQA